MATHILTNQIDSWAGIYFKVFLYQIFFLHPFTVPFQETVPELTRLTQNEIADVLLIITIRPVENL